MSIVELRQTAENEWKAKYQGNYGLYTIRITTNGGKTIKFSCSCPSDYYPCKHIPMIEEAIANKTIGGARQGENNGLKIEEVLKNVSSEELRKFVANQSKYNGELYNAVFLEFAAGVKTTEVNNYSGIIREALVSASTWGNESYYYEEVQDLDALDKWFDKAKSYLGQEQYDEAILVCKACIEEYSQWLYNASEETDAIFDGKYHSTPFDILEDVAKHTDKRELFDYCLSEMKKEKYAETYFYYEFHRLLATLALEVDPDTFIALQDQLLADIADKSSDEARTVLKRKIDFYTRLGQEDKAEALLEENMQIYSFRLKVIEKKIEQQDFQTAKKLIYEFLSGKEGQDHYLDRTWRKLLLDIAQKEKDIPAIRELAYGFIEDHFQKDYYEIYKATFSSLEWVAEWEKLFLRYSSKERFDSSAANVLAIENDAERLMHYIEKYLSSDKLVTYHTVFASAYAEKTLELFKKVIVPYAENNIGRSHYEHILSLLRKMLNIEGGKEVVLDLVAGFRLRYKNRRAMMETLQRL